MPAKLSTIAYIHKVTEKLTQEFSVKELTAVSRLSDDDPTKVVYLKVKTFIHLDQNIETLIEEFDAGDVIFLRGKFVACDNWYSVNATSIKVLENLDFHTMPSVGLSVMIIGITTKTVMNINGKHHLEFYVEENLGEKEPREFWVDTIHDPNFRYISNKVNAINQTMRSTTAVIMGLINYQPPEFDPITQEESRSGNHVVRLEDISLISTRTNNINNNQTGINAPWLQSNSSFNTNQDRSNRSPRGASPRLKRSRTTLSQMTSTTTRLSDILNFPAGMNSTTNTNSSPDTDSTTTTTNINPDADTTTTTNVNPNADSTTTINVNPDATTTTFTTTTTNTSPDTNATNTRNFHSNNTETNNHNLYIHEDADYVPKVQKTVRMHNNTPRTTRNSTKSGKVRGAPITDTVAIED